MTLPDFVNRLDMERKVFDPRERGASDKILPLGLKAIVAKVYKDKSWMDQKECIVLDYSKTSLMAHWIRDEIREVSAGMTSACSTGLKKLIDFALEFPASG